jgi:murein DD-endopeptidase MepM/ murein hydrolase activator NlpD
VRIELLKAFRRSSLKREIPQRVDVQHLGADHLRSKLDRGCQSHSASFRRTRSTTLGLALTLAAAFSIQGQAKAAFQPLQGNSVVNVVPLSGAGAESPQVESLSAPTPLLSSADLVALEGANIAKPAKMSPLKKAKKMAELDIDISQTVIPNHDQSALANAGAIVHKVQSGETLDQISERYEVNAEDILKANGIDSADELGDNAVLRIPAYQDQDDTPKISLKVDEQIEDNVQIEDDIYLDELELTAKLLEGEKEVVESGPELSIPIAARATFPQIPTLVLPPLSSVDTYLPDEMQIGNFNYIMPAKGVLTSGYGPRWGRMHRGIDIAAPVGTTVVASAPGVIQKAGWNSGGYGKLVEVRHSDGSVTRYAHNNRISSRVGQFVRQGEKIAEMGSTGRSTGSHTHFEIRPAGKGAVNPMGLLNRG